MRLDTEAEGDPADLKELLVAQRDVLGGQVGSLVRSRYFPVELRVGITFAGSMRSSPPGVTRRNRFSSGLVEITPRNWPRFVGERSVRAVDHRFQAVDEPGAGGGVAAASGLWQTTNRSVSETSTSLTRRLSATCW